MTTARLRVLPAPCPWRGLCVWLVLLALLAWLGFGLGLARNTPGHYPADAGVDAGDAS